MTINKMKRVLSGFAVLFSATVVSAAEYTAEVRGAVGTTDNLSRTSQNEIDETIMSAGFSLGITEQSSRLDFNLSSRFDYVFYADDTFEEEVIGGANADLSLILVEERLRWNFQDTFGQELTDPLQAATPNNREHVNYFSTGPTINFLASGRNFITLNSTYSRYDYETRPADNDQFAGTFTIGRYIQRDRSLSLNFSADRTEFDNGGLTAPFDRTAAYVRFEDQNERNSWGIDLGYGEFEIRGIEGNGAMLQVDWSKSLTANSALTVSGGSRYSDQGDLFRFEQGQRVSPGDTTDSANSNAPFRNNFAMIGYSLQRERYAVTSSFSWNQQDYTRGLGLDRDNYDGRFQIRRDVSRKVFVNATIEFQHRDFKYISVRDDDLELGLEAGYRVSSGLDVSLEYQHFQRNSTVVNRDYNENRAFLRFTYTPVWSRTSNR